MTTTMEPSITENKGEYQRIMARSVTARDLKKGDIVTNLGIVQGIEYAGVFVLAAIRGTVWTPGTGSGDVFVENVVWHEACQVSVDLL